MSPPIPRPYGPATPADPGAHPQSPEAGEPCSVGTSMAPEDFWDAIRQTVYREILRARYGSGELDRHIVSSLGVTLTDDFIAAMKEGKVVPGLSETTDARGECAMDWIRFACFARYYVMLEGTRRDHLRELLRDGATLTEIETDEILGENWHFCTGTETDEDAKKWCCNDDVVSDAFYADLADGKSPAVYPPADLVEDGSSWGKIAAISLGIVAVAVTLGYLSHTTHPEAARARANPRPEAIRDRALASKVRDLRMETASEYSFETWDEVFEHLRDRTHPSTGEASSAMNALEQHLSRLSSLGVKTNSEYELHHMLSHAAEVAA